MNKREKKSWKKPKVEKLKIHTDTKNITGSGIDGGQVETFAKSGKS